SGVAVKQIIALSRATTDDAATRGGAEPSLDVQLATPPEGYGHVLLSRDENGVLSWHFPTSVPTDSTRGSEPLSVPMQRFTVPVATTYAAFGDGTRGVAAKAVNQVLKVLVYPFLEPIASAIGESLASTWELQHRPYRVRAFVAGDSATAGASALDDEGWRRMASGRSLLLLHGPFGRSHTTFAGWSADTLAALDAQYEGRVFAFDHSTIGHDPLRNARELVARMPAGAAFDVDIVAHSRGGLVARMLVERQDDLALNDRTLRVGKVVLVGTPNAGTMLAEPEHLKTLLDCMTTIFDAIHGEPATEVLHVIVEVVKELAVGMYKGLSGIGAMAPKGEFLKAHNEGPQRVETQYFALASDFTPRDPALMALITSKVLTKMLSGPNDLFVPTASIAGANGSGMFPIAQQRTLTGLESASHFELLSSAMVQDQLLSWLRAGLSS
ncbi:MAG: alpha/beta hydrolase, partial [bacterium]